MPRLSTIAAATLAAAVLAPSATALAADGALRGAPTLRVVDADEATFRFVLDEQLPRKASGSNDARVHFSDQGVSSITSEGRQGDGYAYAARVKSARGLKVGQKYTVRIVVAGGDDDVVRRVQLRR